MLMPWCHTHLHSTGHFRNCLRPLPRRSTGTPLPVVLMPNPILRILGSQWYLARLAGFAQKRRVRLATRSHILRLRRLLCGKAPPFRAGHLNPLFFSRGCASAKSSRLPPSDSIQIHLERLVLLRPPVPTPDARPAIILGTLHQSRSHRVLMNVMYPLHEEALAK